MRLPRQSDRRMKIDYEVRGKSRRVNGANVKKLMDIAVELFPGHHLDLYLSGRGTHRGKFPYPVAQRKPSSLEELKRFASEEPKLVRFHHRQLRLSSEELEKVFKELLAL